MQKGSYSQVARQDNPYHLVADKEHFSKGPRSHPGLSDDEFYTTSEMTCQGKGVQPRGSGVGDRNSTNTRQRSTNPFESDYSPERQIPNYLELENFNDAKTSGSDFTVPDSDEIQILEAQCAEQEAIRRKRQQVRDELIRKNHEKKLELKRRLASLRRDNEAKINDEPLEIMGEVEQLKLQEQKLLQAQNLS